MTESIPPMPFQWDGEIEALRPRHPKLAGRHFVDTVYYTMAPWEDRSIATHNHQFAWLHQAWQNLPEDLADAYPTPEHLRKRALIEAGFYDEDVIDAGTKAAALRVASHFRKRDDFAWIVVRGPVVVVRTAKSQSRRYMDKDTFQKSKTAIMEIIANMIGSTPAQLEAEGGNTT